MKRTHRMLREAHARRGFRVKEAAGRGAYDAVAELKAFERLLGEFVADGHFSREPLGNAIEAMAYQVAIPFTSFLCEDGLAEEIAQGIAAEVFADRLSSGGRYKVQPRDREVAKGCMALGEAALLDRVYRALEQVLRTMAVVHHRERPCWPVAYRERQNDARLAGRVSPTEDDAEVLVVDEGGALGHTEASSKTSLH